MSRKKKIFTVAAVLVVIIVAAAVYTVNRGGRQTTDNEQTEETEAVYADAIEEGLVGSYYCYETASDGKTDTSYYNLYIDSDGSFSLYDGDAGNPGISGKFKMKIDSEYTGDSGTLALVECDEDEFDPPGCWKMSTDSDLSFEIIDENNIRLGYKNNKNTEDIIWLTFFRRTEEE